MCCCVRVDTYCKVTNKTYEAGCIGQHKYCISLYYLAFVTIIKIYYYITTTTTIKTITLAINPYISQETISYPMFVYGIRVCTYPESVVSHEAVGRMWYDWFRVGTNPYPVNKHGITILSFDHTLMNTNLTKRMVTHIELVNINRIIIFNLIWRGNSEWLKINQMAVSWNESEARMGYRAAEQGIRKNITVMRNVIWLKGNTGLYYPPV